MNDGSFPPARTLQQAALSRGRRRTRQYVVEPIIHGPRVYFVQASSGLIKIGWSCNVGARVAVLGHEEQALMRLLGSVPGDHRTEHAWHDHFLALRDHGEWFDPAPRLLAGIGDAITLNTTPDYVFRPETGPFPRMRLGRPRAARRKGTR